MPLRHAGGRVDSARPGWPAESPSPRSFAAARAEVSLGKLADASSRSAAVLPGRLFLGGPRARGRIDEGGDTARCAVPGCVFGCLRGRAVACCAIGRHASPCILIDRMNARDWLPFILPCHFFSHGRARRVHALPAASELADPDDVASGSGVGQLSCRPRTADLRCADRRPPGAPVVPAQRSSPHSKLELCELNSIIHRTAHTRR